MKKQENSNKIVKNKKVSIDKDSLGLCCEERYFLKYLVLVWNDKHIIFHECATQIVRSCASSIEKQDKRFG